MATRGEIIRCKETSDVKNLVVAKGAFGVALAVVESDANPAVEIDAVPLITAILLPSQAIRLARALLAAAGCIPIEEMAGPRGNVQTFRFID